MRRIFLFFFGGLTLIALAADGLVSLSEGALMYRPLGEVWYALDPATLNGAQAGIQRYLAPWLWDPGLVTVLQAPAWIVPLGITLAILVLRRR